MFHVATTPCAKLIFDTARECHHAVMTTREKNVNKFQVGRRKNRHRPHVPIEMTGRRLTKDASSRISEQGVFT